MASILGIGLTHYPPLAWQDAHMADILKLLLDAPGVPASFKDRSRWPAEMLVELGGDGGLSAAAAHRAALVAEFRRMRERLDEFRPDFVVVFGDDQYENFREDLVPPFCVLALDETEIRPFASGATAMRPNVWGEPREQAFRYPGHRAGAKALARGLLERGIDLPYAYRTLHDDGLAHAFANTLLYLDYDRRGFPYPVVPFQVNCYGSTLLATRGGFGHLLRARAAESTAVDPDPPGPAPWRCMEVGAAIADTLRDSPWRVALIASSSWSHAFLTPRTGYLWPDHASDRRLLAALRAADYRTWRQTPLGELEAAGEHELLNWCVLLGAMQRLGRRARVEAWIETWIFNSNKCFAWFPPEP